MPNRNNKRYKASIAGARSSDGQELLLHEDGVRYRSESSSSSSVDGIQMGTLTDDPEDDDDPEKNHHRKKRGRQLTVADAVEKIGMGPFQLMVITISGVYSACDAMEMMLLAVLAPILQCEWLLNEYQVALITTVVFVGYLFMAPVWGSLSDHYGRRKVLIAVALWISFYGFLTTFAPTYMWVLALRCCVGAGVAGASQGFVLTSEYIPNRWRARLLVAGNIFWTIGSIFEIAAATLIIPNVSSDYWIPGWRILVLISSIPMMFVNILLYWLPESARYLVAAGRNSEARAILDDAAKMNHQPKLPGPLKAEPRAVRGSVKELFQRGTGLAPTTIGCWVLWFTAAFTYYGMILISAVLADIQQQNCNAGDDQLSLEKTSGGVICSCSPPSRESYVSMLISTIGELASLLLNWATVDRLGRKMSMALYLAMQGAAFMLLIPSCGMPVSITTMLAFTIRCVSAAFFNVVYIYVVEVYPTRVRAIALGSCSAAARVGALLTPFVAQVLIAQNRTAALVVYGVVSLLAAVVAWFMPIESKDRHLAT